MTGRVMICESVLDAVAGIADGATILVGGFGSAGQPVALVEALLEGGARELTVVSNNAGGGDHGLAALIRDGRVRKVVCSYPRQSDSWHFDAAYRAGQLELELEPQGTLAERIRAAGSGIGAFFTPTGYGTPLAEGKESRVIGGRGYLLEYPLPGDVALVAAHRSDELGNLVYRKTARNFGPVMAAAATTAIAQVDDIVPTGVNAWPEDRIWDELQARVAGPDGFTLKEGPVTDKAVLRFRSFVAEPMRHGRLLLAGDAAHTVPPTGAKGLNLALADVRVLAEVLERAVRSGDDGTLDEYGPRALARVWKAQHFSYWMTTMLHALPGSTPFDLRRQLGELESVASSVAGSTYLAEAYTGWPRR